jgi:DNA-binding GntR family transcriptional regulator
LVNQIYDLLKKKIINHEILPGEKISIAKYSKEFQVSHIPIREVINRLVMDGLVMNIPNHSYYVVKLTEIEIQEIYELRKMIECYSLKKAIKVMDKNKLKELLGALYQFKEDIGKLRDINKIEEYYEKIINFHLLIVESTSNSKIIDTYLHLINLIKMIIKFDRRKELYERSINVHISLVGTMINNNLSGASDILDRHLDYAFETIKTKI